MDENCVVIKVFQWRELTMKEWTQQVLSNISLGIIKDSLGTLNEVKGLNEVKDSKREHTLSIGSP